MHLRHDNSSRHPGIDIIKTIAVFFVVIYHSSQVGDDKYAFIDIVSNPSFTSYANYFIMTLLSTCVPLFFMVNGALMLNRPHLSTRKHILRIIKVAIIFGFWSLVMTSALEPIYGEPIGAAEKIKLLFTLKQGWNHPLWFFYALAICFAFLPILRAAFRHHRSAFYFFATLVFIFTFSNVFLWQAENIAAILGWRPKAFSDANIDVAIHTAYNPFTFNYAYTLGYYMLGGILFYYSNTIKQRISPLKIFLLLPIPLTLLWGYAIMVSLHRNKVWDVTFFGYSTIFTLFTTALVFSWSLSHEAMTHRTTVLVTLISEHSLGIYVISWIIEKYLAEYIHIPGAFSWILFGSFVFITSLLLSVSLSKLPILHNMTTLRSWTILPDHKTIL